MSSSPKKSAKTVQNADDQDIVIDPLDYFKPTKHKAIKKACQKCGSDKHIISDCPSWISELDKKQIHKASDALLRFHTQQKKGRRNLLEEAEPVYLHLQLFDIPKNPGYIVGKYQALPLKTPVRDLNQTEVCVIVKDKAEFKTRILDFGIPQIVKVIDLKKLREKYKQYESRRKLADSYDLFICDKAIKPLMVGLLGKSFGQKKKLPIALKFRDLRVAKQQIEYIIHNTYLPTPKGQLSLIEIGKTDMTAKQITENLNTLLPALLLWLERGWFNVYTLAVRTKTSPPLFFFKQVQLYSKNGDKLEPQKPTLKEEEEVKMETDDEEEEEQN